ncbi:MAG TPA: hypothetical protein VJL90_14555 [Pseudorhodoplanes sp.]|nr:hypothetical protein [Pseudorhodoplanes sp.]
MHRQISRQEGAARLTKIRRALWWIAIGVPLALLAMVSADGISFSDLGVVAFVTVILWLFVFLTGLRLTRSDGKHRMREFER